MRDDCLNRASALVGGGIWLATFAAAMVNVWQLGLIALVLLLAVLVVTPLGLALIDSPERGWLRAASFLQPFAALLVCASFALPVGLSSALLTSVWLLFAGLLAIAGLRRLKERRPARVDEVCIDAALLFLPVGAIWLIFSRAGVQPGGFREPIILLTAVHFHYAGFGAPLLAGLAGRELWSAHPSARRVFRVVSSGIIVAIPLVAISFGRWPVVETAGVVLLTASLLLLSLLVLFHVVPAINGPIARVFMLVSTISPVVPMLLASIYSLGLLFDNSILTIPQMARFHGAVNAFGFVLCGLLGWALERRSPGLSVSAD